ncbi:MAG: ATP-binding protein [Nocardioides sp.]
MLRDREAGAGVGTGTRTVLLLALILVSTWVVVGTASPHTRVAFAWPASGLSAGVLLLAPRSQRWPLLAATTGMVLLARLAQGVDPLTTLLLSASAALETVLVVVVLERRPDRRRPALLDDGDVSRMVLAITVACGSAGVVKGLVVASTGVGNPWLAAIAVFGTHAASIMVLLPFFLETPDFPALGAPQERATQWVLALGTTILIFLAADVPPAVFVVMPMFAWLGFRGTLREATLLLTAVGIVTTTMTAMHLGPVWGLGERYGLPEELVIGFLQLFLLDCGLILLPLSVSVTQQRLSAAQAAAGRETLERLVASATGTAIMVVDLEGRVVVFNPGAEALLGYDADEVVGEVPDRFELHEAHTQERPSAAGFLDICREVAASDTPRRLWEFTRKDGQSRTMLMTLASVPDAQGRVTGYLATAEDVTEREQAQAALLQALAHQDTAVQRLRELDQIKTDFVSTVSHELRTPITSIVGYTELLEDGEAGELTKPQMNLVARVDRNSRRLLTLIDDLLTLSQVESTDLRINPVTCDLRGAVSGAYDALTPSLETRRLEVVVDLPPEPVDFHGDPVQLERMTLNLLTNAVKFTPDGGRVEVVLDAEPDAVRLVVSDTGIGIAESDRHEVFSRFYRSTAATERAIQGTGLGLSIVQSIVSLHQGSIELDSELDRGTTATVVLPRGAARGAA